MATGQSTATFSGVPLDVLEAKILDRVVRVPSGCWEWSGYRTDHGYGKIQRTKPKPKILTHRASYAVFCGDPGDSFVLHKCDNPPCCNPTHLFLGTHDDNMADCKRKGRTAGRYRPIREVLSDEQQDAIRREHRPWDRTASIPVLAKKYGISQRSVFRIIRGK